MKILLTAVSSFLLFSGSIRYEIPGVHDYAAIGMATVFVDFPESTSGPDADLIRTTCEILDQISTGEIQLKRPLHEYRRLMIDFSEGLGRTGVPAGFGHFWPDKVKEETESGIGSAFLRNGGQTGIIHIVVERTARGPRMESSKFRYSENCKSK